MQKSKHISSDHEKLYQFIHYKLLRFELQNDMLFQSYLTF